MKKQREETYGSSPIRLEIIMHGSATNVDEYLANVPEWQRVKLSGFRDLVQQVEPDMTEEIKWGVPAFVHDKKIVFTMGSFKSHVKYNFILNGALIEDSEHLFNNGLESSKSRSIDLREGETVDIAKLKNLIVKALTLTK